MNNVIVIQVSHAIHSVFRKQTAQLSLRKADRTLPSTSDFRNSHQRMQSGHATKKA